METLKGIEHYRARTESEDNKSSHHNNDIVASNTQYRTEPLVLIFIKIFQIVHSILHTHHEVFYCPEELCLHSVFLCIHGQDCQWPSECEYY